jgi:TonB family protein
MTTATYQELALAWHPQKKTDKKFVGFTFAVLLFFMGLGFFMGTIEVPKDNKRQKVEIPERIAKFILEKPKVKPKPKPKVIKKEPPKPKVIEKKKIKPKDDNKVKVKIKKQPPKKVTVLTKKQAKARQNASESGLLALSNELSDLIDTSSIDNMVSAKLMTNSNSDQLAVNTNNVLTANATTGSGGVSTGKVLSHTKATVKLDKAQIAAAQQLLLARADNTIIEGVDEEPTNEQNYQRTGNYRPEEDIAYVMDKNKSKLHALYRKARRSNPSIKGKIILEITISPAGKVLSVIIASSELNDKKLESRIVARVKGFNFGVAKVKAVTVTYPVEFLPS